MVLRVPSTLWYRVSELKVCCFDVSLKLDFKMFHNRKSPILDFHCGVLGQWFWNSKDPLNLPKRIGSPTLLAHAPSVNQTTPFNFWLKKWVPYRQINTARSLHVCFLILTSVFKAPGILLRFPEQQEIHPMRLSFSQPHRGTSFNVIYLISSIFAWFEILVHALQNGDPVIMTLSFFLDCLMILRGKSRSIPISSSIQKPGPSKYASCETKRNHSSWCQLSIKTGQTLGMMYRTSPKPRRVLYGTVESWV